MSSERQPTTKQRLAAGGDREATDKALGRITPRECASMRLLSDDGWTTGELKMTFHLTRGEAVRNHINGNCTHELEEVEL